MTRLLQGAVGGWAVGQSLLQAGHQCIALEGFAEVTEGAGGHHAVAYGIVGKAGDEDDRISAPAFDQAALQRGAIDAGHVDIRDEAVDSLVTTGTEEIFSRSEASHFVSQ